MRLGFVSSQSLCLLALFLSVAGVARGQQPLYVGSSPINFGALSPGQTSAASILVVQNMNSVTVAIGTPTIGGTNPGDFAITINQCPSSLTAGNSCAVYVDFAPTAEGARTATLSVSSTYGTGSATLNGTAVPATFSPATVSFPATLVGQTSTTEITTLTNNTSSALTGLSATVTSGYAITANTCTGTLAASPASCTVTMTFSPTAIGPVTGTLSVVDNIGTQTAALTGMGLAATAPAVTFPTEAVGATESATVLFTFATTTTLPSSSVTVLTQGNTGLDFTSGTQLGTACTAQTYNAGQSCTVVVNFKAGAPGKRQGAVSLYNYISTPYNNMTPIIVGTAYLQGIGTGADAVFYPGTGTSAISSYNNGPTVPTVNAAGTVIFGDTRGIYYTPAGSSGTYTLVPSGGHAVNIDGAGNIYYAAGNTVYEIPFFGAPAAPNEQTPIEIATLPSATDNSMMIDGVGDLFIPTYGTGSGGGIYEIATGTYAVTNVIPQAAATSDGKTLGRTIGTYMDAAGDMYLADFTNNKIDEVLAGSSTVTVIQGADGYLNQPYSVAVDAAGDFFVTNYGGFSYLLKYELVSGSYVRSQYTDIIANDGVTFDQNENLVLVAGDNITRYTRTATPTLTFPTAAEGSTSATQSTNLQNEGNAPLTFTSIAASSSNFSTSGTTCTTTTPLAIGANCNIVAAFTPQSSGTLSGTANLVGNNLAATTETQTVALTGTANYNVAFTTAPPASLQTGQSAGTVTAGLTKSNGSADTTAPATAITLVVTGPSGYTTATYTGTTATTGAGAGTVTFNLTAALTITGGYTYSLSDANGDTAGSVNENVYPYKLAISGLTTPQASSAATNSVTVAITDNSGNATTQANSITLVVTGPNSYSQTYGPTAAGANGAVTFTAAAISVPGTYLYTASATASPDGVVVTGTSANQVITAAMATLYTVTPASTTAVIGYPDSVTVKAYDAYGNLVTNYAGTVMLTSTDPGPATLPAPFTLSSGTATVPVTFLTATNTGWTVTATDTMNSLLTNTSAAIVVQPIPVYTINSSNAASDTSAACTSQSLAGSATGTTTDTDCTIYAAFAAVTALNNTALTSYVPVINFATNFPATLTANTLTLATPVSVTGNFALNGPGATALTLTGGNAVNVNFLTQTAASLSTISGLTFTQFNAANGSVFAPNGGTTNITNDVFSSNVSTGSYGGGVLFQTAGTLNISGSSFMSNTSTNSGGAMWLQGAITISNSTFTGNSSTNAGAGAIEQNSGTLTLSGNTYTSNTAKTDGGAIYGNINVTETGATYTTNSSGATGGALHVAGTYTVGNSTFTGNHGGTDGGAVYAATSLSMSTGTTSFTSNYLSATTGGVEGGAVWSTGGSPISGANFVSNYAKTSSGAAYGGAAYLTNTTTAVSNSLFSGNYVSGTSTANGGALYGAGKYTGVTFYGNSTAAPSTTGATTQEGGAIYSSSTVSLYNDTITGNSAKIGGGVYRGSAVTAYNTVISGNTATSSYKDEYSVTVSGTNYIDTSTNLTCTTNCAALLSALGNYGGPTQTMVPLPGSPLLAAGTNAAANTNSASIDGRGTGYSRAISYNGAAAHVDLGAVEANYMLSFVTQPVTVQSGSAFSPQPSVQVYESGVLFAPNVATSSLNFAAATGTLSGSGLAAVNASGLGTLSATITSSPTADDSLTASVRSGATGTVVLAATTSQLFSVTDAAMATINFVTPPTYTTVNGGNAGVVKVGLYSSASTVDTTASNTVTLNVSGPSGYTATYGPSAAVQGVATFDLSAVPLTANGSYTYTASSNYTTDTAVAPETVGAQAIGNFLVVGIPTAANLNTSYSFTVTAKDTTGATFTSFTGTISLASNDASAVFAPPGYTFTSADGGVHTFTVAFGTGGVRSVTVTTDGGVMGSESGIAVGDFIWSVNANGTVTKLTETGSSVTGAVGMSGSASSLGGVAFDSSGNVWSVTSANNTLDFVTKAGVSSSMFTGGGLSTPVSVAVDGNGYIWVANAGNSSISTFNSAGTAVSAATTGDASPSLSTPSAIAIDSTGGVWVTNKGSNSVTHVFGAAAPVATPLATTTTNATTGAKP